jgi:hypothetical protein
MAPDREARLRPLRPAPAQLLLPAWFCAAAADSVRLGEHVQVLVIRVGVNVLVLVTSGPGCRSDGSQRHGNCAARL